MLSTKALLAAKATLVKFDTQTSRFASEKARIEQSAELTDSTARQYSEAQAGLALADRLRPEIHNNVIIQVEEFMQLLAESIQKLHAVYPIVDDQIEQQVLDSVHDDVRGSIDARKSKPFLNEQAARRMPSHGTNYIEDTATSEQIQAFITDVLRQGELVVAEQTRLVSVTKKYGVDFKV